MKKVSNSYTPRLLLKIQGKLDYKHNYIFSSNGEIQCEYIEKRKKDLEVLKNKELLSYQGKSKRLIKKRGELEEQKKAVDQLWKDSEDNSTPTTPEEVIMKNLSEEKRGELLKQSIHLQKQMNNIDFQLDRMYLKFKMVIERNVQIVNRQYIAYARYAVAKKVGTLDMINASDYTQDELIKKTFNIQ